MNPIKKFFFDHWDEMRSEGEYPTIDINLIGKLGFKKKSNEIHDYYIEYIGGKEIGEKNLLDFLSNKTFKSSELNFRQWDDEDFKFTFKLSNVRINKHREDKEILADMDILDGYINMSEYNDIEDNYYQKRYDISRGNNEIDDMVSYFDVQDQLKTIVESFIVDMGIKYGADIEDVVVNILN
jgi:hypothetical protein